MLYVRSVYRQLNTFSRGVIDPRDMHLSRLYDEVESKLSKKLGRNPTHDEIMDYMAVTPNRGSTGHGDLDRRPGEYALYTSNGLDQAVGYALRGNHPYNVDPSHRAVYELELPERIPSKSEMDTRFSPIGNYILHNRFALLDRRHNLKDLYSEYGLPYQLATGRSLSSDVPATVDYNKSLKNFANNYNIPIFDKKNVAESFVREAKRTNEKADEINNVLKTLGVDIRMPYTSYKTSRSLPHKLIRNRTVINPVHDLVYKYEKSLLDWPEYMHDKLNKLFLGDVKRTLKDAKKINDSRSKNLPFLYVVKKPGEAELKALVERKLGKTPATGYLKHPYAKNVFTTEGYKKPLTVNDKRYRIPTRSGTQDASLQHYVFFNNNGEPILNIKRRVPFDEWMNVKNRGSSHWGSYFPGYSRRMRNLLIPVVGANYLYNADDKK